MANDSKKRLKITPAPADHPIFSTGFVVGGNARKPSPENSSKPPKNRGRGLPHRYPWIDEGDVIQPSESPEKDVDE